MSNFGRTLRQTLTIARRDFIATVFTPTFLLFLLAPLFMIGFGLVGGLGAQSMDSGAQDKVRVVAIAPASQSAMIVEADRELRTLFPPRGDYARPPLTLVAPATDVAAQARAMFDSRDYEAAAVLYGPLDRPEILYAPRGRDDAAYLAELAEQALRNQKLGSAARLSTPTRTEIKREGISLTGKSQVASIGVFGMFFLTLFLSSQAVGTMAEERSNKVIEILAAAVPLESVFLGKLVGMFAVAVLFILFWATLLLNAAKFIPGDVAGGLSGMGSAVGMPAYALLFIAYFTMAYMLLGAVFLSIGAQTSTQRELQMLSLPITIFQMLMFGFSLAAASSPGSWVALAAEIFPFSSPFAMIGRAGNSPELWPHLLALAWQAMWVAITVTLGARWFRRGVLKSGSPKFRLKAMFAR
ncbi:ABC transporter permease [Sphingomonas sp. M1-B02]|uniref:ABC transporter permease n=1 Tax=Sphingomonas sp. M1-B02 TaxID=3114300 RepID=UPI00223EA3AA|nr:ABC transporter permease [Sphingomonas sp. S6-11]UZK67647.1 ABC transporter permease [Sphingomonas sp. S6-11]